MSDSCSAEEMEMKLIPQFGMKSLKTWAGQPIWPLWYLMMAFLWWLVWWCSRKWKQWIQSRGRSFIFSTALPIPVVAAAHGIMLKVFNCLVVSLTHWKKVSIVVSIWLVHEIGSGGTDATLQDVCMCFKASLYWLRWEFIFLHRFVLYFLLTTVINLISTNHLKWIAAALMVAKKEKWRQHNVWERVQQFSEATGLHFTSPIAPIVFGNPEVTLNGSRYCC